MSICSLLSLFLHFVDTPSLFNVFIVLFCLLFCHKAETETSDGTRSRLVSGRDENGAKFLVSSRLEDNFQILVRDKNRILISRPRNHKALLSKILETRRERGKNARLGRDETGLSISRSRRD